MGCVHLRNAIMHMCVAIAQPSTISHQHLSSLQDGWRLYRHKKLQKVLVNSKWKLTKPNKWRKHVGSPSHI